MYKTEENFIKDNWDYLKDNMLPRTSDEQFTRQQFKDIYGFKEDRNGNIRFKKIKKQTIIKAGDIVWRDQIRAEVVDTDGELVCVKDIKTNEVYIWNIKEITREKP